MESTTSKVFQLLVLCFSFPHAIPGNLFSDITKIQNWNSTCLDHIFLAWLIEFCLLDLFPKKRTAVHAIHFLLLINPLNDRLMRTTEHFFLTNPTTHSSSSYPAIPLHS